MEIADIEELLEEEEDIPTINTVEEKPASPPGHRRKPAPTYEPPPPAPNWSKIKASRNQPQSVESTSTAMDYLKIGNPAKIGPVVTLNVGGVFYTTLRSTLLRFADSMLAAMFSGRHESQLDQRGAHFIDRNGAYFGYILEFLRTDVLPSSDVAVGVLMEARYYGLDELEDRMNVIPSISAQIVKENHRSQFPEYEENKKRIVQIAMENATVSKTGEVLIYAFRTEFVPKAPNFNINHHCSADQAHISIGPWESIADEETLIKSIESDLIDEHFNVRVHEGKRRCKYFYGQSCQKCTFRIQIMFG